MAIEEYIRPRTEAPNRVKSDQQLKDEEQSRIDVERWMSDNKVTEGSPLYSKEQYKRLSDKDKESAGIYLTRISYGKKWD